MNSSNGVVDLLVIGAGPSGAVVSAMLVRQGYRVVVLEKGHFPRFSIGESLLPQCMEFLAEAGMKERVEAEGFQFKNGAAFAFGECRDAFDFTEKFSPGPGTTFQVPRARFDQVLADEAQQVGADIRYGHEVTAIERDGAVSRLSVVTDAGESYQIEAGFVLDASGFGRVMPRLLGLDRPSELPLRKSIMTHVEDRIDDQEYDRNKILITVHPQHQDVWFWLIPFSDGRSSVGVVAHKEFYDRYGEDDARTLKTLIGESGWPAALLAGAEFDTQVRSQVGYSANVSQLHGDGFALLGNAGEFLDPVFSSGVTIAMKSASLAAKALDRHLRGESVDWNTDYAEPLMQGVNTFREFVLGWYDGRLQDVIFSAEKNAEVKRMISSVLAGYAWDTQNPYVKDPKRLSTLAEICRARA
ncbi:NAD(P)/FAD-dependent oxidoreductase [Marinobacterium lutimaris]|uniref:Dehydrogenase (Flavoprotein) n=1 Tax=Marinobacterium lutimaris TaxID=568106 RepID=A0A1H5TEB7_9GAMM|nr:NAD(P)/FAD-dependent oxidoreductase [Marinobacterium lutimaris]SEF60347.1 Dehydrogenase (flavoprotein) [Marinobacterium lutimaris]